MAQSKTTATTKKKSTKKELKPLLIVESPSKAKTIKKYLGNKFEVLSSKGHIRDLPASRLGVDVQNNFEPEYTVSRKDGKAEILRQLKDAAKKSSDVFLATDPDREGEAIAWHLAQLLHLDETKENRVTFNEVTKKAVREGVQNPRTIDRNLVNAQQTRRILDRLVGYKLSPFLWKKVKKGLSAGRVQSVATRLVVDREREIQAFVPQEYWNIDAWFKNGNKKYAARLAADTNGKIAVTNKEQADKIRKDLEGAEYCVSNIKTQEKQKNPQPPFITSSLLQDASNRLNMSSRRTMTLAQHLYEGLEVKGHGLVGLITYMRTDSPRISDEARAAAKELIEAKYGAEYYPKTPRVFKTKKDAQDAHEAIRPTDVNLTPETVRESLTPEHYRLYKLIWDRFMASQMASAVYNTRSVEITANGYLFRASDSQLLFDGFTTLYHDAEEEQDKTEKLPAMEENTVLPFAELTADQKFTQPPARYNEASLIQAMKDYGIGRPSTYATIIGTILDRNYVEHESRSLKPTQLGYVTTDLMIDHFKNIVDTDFTADMETKLDIIEEGETTSLDVLQSFYTDFAQSLKIAEEKMDGVKIALPLEESDVVCELCGRKMVYKVSRFGRFLACPGYPECKNTKPIRTTAPGKCPKCGSGLLVKKTKTGKVYYGCEKNGECGFMTWDIPTTETCPKCGNTLFRHLSKLNCQKEGCDYSAAVEKKSKKDTSNGDEADES